MLEVITVIRSSLIELLCGNASIDNPFWLDFRVYILLYYFFIYINVFSNDTYKGILGHL